MPPDATAPASLPPVLPGWERVALGLLLGLFVAVGLNNIHHLAFMGQDFSFHVGCTNRLLAHPGEWFTQDTTNRPLIYWIALDGMWLTADRAPYQFAAVVFLLCNTGALWLVHDSARRFITTPALRLAAVGLVAFLPATLIASVVFAADAMAAPLFALLCWSVIRWAETPAPRASLGYAGLAGAALGIGNFAKSTFLVLPAAVLVVSLLLWRWGRIRRTQLIPFGVLAVLAPTLVGGWLHLQAHRALADRPAWHQFNWHGTGELTWRSLLLVKPTDARVLDAPGYWDFEIQNGQKRLPLLAPNGYSYPALLHLGIFTDVLDFANRGNTDNGTPRPQPQKQFSQWAVRTGLLYSIPAVLGVLWLVGRSALACLQPRRAPRTGAGVWTLLGLAWFLPIVLPLPFVVNAYEWGYWLPRLVIPTLWSAGLALFSLLDERIGRRQIFCALILAATILQTWLHVRSVWY